jgi:hypothetical protein
MGVAFGRELHSCRPSLAEVNIEVPSMGDSITEGTVASVEKAEGVSCKRYTLLRILSAGGWGTQPGGA